MSEKTFYKMLLLSMAFHLVFLAAVGTSFKKTSRSINPLLNSYSVNLVDDVGGRSKDTGTRPLPNQRSSLPPRPQKQTPEMKKVKPVNQPKEAREPVHSLSPRKLPPKESTGTTKEELKRLEERIREIKRRTANSESPSEARRTAVMRGSEGSSGSGAGSGGQNPALIRYLIAMRDKIESSWHIPFMGSAKKNLEAKVIIKVRRDGRILDISIDKRSGNRAYDESVLRALRAIDPLPPIPSSIDEDPLEVEMTLRPEGVS
jgi:colicin import membrane protein